MLNDFELVIYDDQWTTILEVVDFDAANTLCANIHIQQIEIAGLIHRVGMSTSYGLPPSQHYKLQ